MSPRIVQPTIFTDSGDCPIDRSSYPTGRFSAIFRDFPNKAFSGMFLARGGTAFLHPPEELVVMDSELAEAPEGPLLDGGADFVDRPRVPDVKDSQPGDFRVAVVLPRPRARLVGLEVFPEGRIQKPDDPLAEARLGRGVVLIRPQDAVSENVPVPPCERPAAGRGRLLDLAEEEGLARGSPSPWKPRPATPGERSGAPRRLLRASHRAWRR